MCGIAGIFDVKQSKEFDRVTLASNLLRAIEVRGRHATGYAYHDDEGSTIIVKADITASDFVEAAPLFAEPFAVTPRTVLLHTRHATQGKASDNENNHPIYSKVTGLTLIHNGWLTNEKQILRKYRLKKDGEVDSETILRLIEHFLLTEKKRISTAIKLAMNELEGRFACALISEKYPDALWLWTRGNPLAGYRDDTTGAFIFASTPSLLTLALGQSNITPKKIGALADGRLICLKVKNGKMHGAFGKLKTYRRARQKPIHNDLPLIGMPRSDLDAAWSQWKEQGKQIDLMLAQEPKRKVHVKCKCGNITPIGEATYETGHPWSQKHILCCPKCRN